MFGLCVHYEGPKGVIAGRRWQAGEGREPAGMRADNVPQPVVRALGQLYRGLRIPSLG